jgi:hypothetical protein
MEKEDLANVEIKTEMEDEKEEMKEEDYSPDNSHYNSTAVPPPPEVARRQNTELLSCWIRVRNS